jgi:hypothetical protein
MYRLKYPTHPSNFDFLCERLIMGDDDVDEHRLGGLRHRTQRSKQSEMTTQLPWRSPNGDTIQENTPIPGKHKTDELTTTNEYADDPFHQRHANRNNLNSILTPELSQNAPLPSIGPRKAMSGEAVKKDESRITKFLVRAVSGILLVRLQM